MSSGNLTVGRLRDILAEADPDALVVGYHYVQRRPDSPPIPEALTATGWEPANEGTLLVIEFNGEEVEPKFERDEFQL